MNATRRWSMVTVNDAVILLLREVAEDFAAKGDYAQEATIRNLRDRMIEGEYEVPEHGYECKQCSHLEYELDKLEEEKEKLEGEVEELEVALEKVKEATKNL